MRQQTIVDTQRAAGLLFATSGKPQTLVRRLVEPVEAVASVYCSLDSLTEIDGSVDRNLRIQALADQLRPQGASDAVVNTVISEVAARPATPAIMAMFVDANGQVLHEALLTAVDIADRVAFGVPADVRPLLQWHQNVPAHIVVVVDRVGADLTVNPGRGESIRTITVTGPDDEITHSAPGGWAGLSQSRFQNRAEDSWHHNAASVSAAVVEEAAVINAEVIVLVGDARAVNLVQEHLPAEHVWQVRTITGGRSADGSQASRADAVAEVLAQVAVEKDRWAVEQLREQTMKGGLGVEGARDTLAALAADRVAVLLVSDEIRPGIAWFAESGTNVFADEEAARASGQPVFAGGIAEVAVRSALLSGARVRVLSAGTEGMPADGIGAICRYA
jgi:hypothetical protein